MTREAKVWWRFPGSKEFIEYTGIWEPLTAHSSPGFIVAPFAGSPLIVQSPGKSIPLPSKLYSKISIQEDASELYRDVYIGGVEELLKAMRANVDLHKVVLSRIRTFQITEEADTEAMFFELCRQYPNAACSRINIGESVWLGASPELLMDFQSGQLRTMSLAGTVSVIEGRKFTEKEETEQTLVTEELYRILQQSGAIGMNLQGPFIRQAGNLLHLCTEIQCQFPGNPITLAAQLHPTPAVGGLPKEKSLEWIQQLEQHERGLFSGYLGPSAADELSLYVHLRCMELRNKKCTLYAGAGITAESVPEEEWKETENKTETLFSVLFRNAGETIG